jgi:hypothetical protein
MEVISLVYSHPFDSLTILDQIPTEFFIFHPKLILFNGRRSEAFLSTAGTHQFSYHYEAEQFNT